MNRRRDEPKSSASMLVAVILTAAVAAGGGVLHAYYKNRQIQTSREIDAAERRIEQYRLEIRTTEMRMDELLNRFVIRKQLQENGSNLRPIQPSAVEEIDSPPPGRRSVASTTP